MASQPSARFRRFFEMWYLQPGIMEEDRFCPRCTTPLEARNTHGAERPVCPACGTIIYYDPKLVTTVVVEDEGKVLMVRRATEPGLGLWSFPGGYVDRGEVVERAAVREVLEETGFRVNIGGLVGLFSEEGHPVVLAAFHGWVVDGRTAAGHEVLEVGFFRLDQLPPLAFPRDVKVLEAWRTLRDNHG